MNLSNIFEFLSGERERKREDRYSVSINNQNYMRVFEEFLLGVMRMSIFDGSSL